MASVCFHVDENCGESRGKTSLVKLISCDDDVKSHLLAYHLSRDNLSEQTLILARSGIFDVKDEEVANWWVCPRHRHSLGKFWLPNKRTCNMPNHCGALKTLTGRDVMTLDLAIRAQKLYGLNVPLGAAICCPCRKKLKASKEESEQTKQVDSNSLYRSTKQCAAEGIRQALLSSTPAKPFDMRETDWLPETPDSVVHESLTTFNKCFTKLSTVFHSKSEFLPLQSRMKSNWDDASQKEREKCVKTAKAACEMVCDVIAPNAKDELLKSLNSTKEYASVSKELELLMWIYKMASSKSLKTQILSIYADWYPVKFLIKHHEKYEKVTEWQVRKAKEHAKKTGPGIPEEKLKRHRVRLDVKKVDHFLEFINRPYFYQDVAFGTRKLKLENGEVLSMPNVVRTVTRSTMIAQYLSFCKEEGVEPLSRSTLYRILEVRKSSQRKSLQGLDNTAADGASAFDTLESVLYQLEKSGASTEWIKATKTALKDSKRYLKTQYKINCREDSSCADHCHVFALSDETDKDFQKTCHDEHNAICNDCEKLKCIFQEIEKKCQETISDVETRDDFLYDIQNSKTAIENWKAHILRSENQDRAKQDCLKIVDANTIVILLDWAMKFTQVKYREKQSEWYGKRGLNWHICTVVSMNDQGKKELTSYAHLFDSCTQDWFSVLSIIENILSTLKGKYPSITKAYFRSDEAGCYHNNFIIAALKDVSKRVGIEVERYDFSEPQHGKDLCDRILCPLKASIRKFCNEGNDITTAAEMRNALKERPVKGTTASVNIVRTEANELEVKRIHRFSALHNFCFEDNGVRVWKAYGIGDGKLIPYDKWQSKSQGPTLLKVENGQEFFHPCSQRVLKEPAVGATESSAYTCPERECYVSFESLEDLEVHMEIGQHKQQEKLCLYDKLRLDWVSRFTELTLEEDNTIKPQHQEKKGKSSLTMGWALHKLKGGGKRFSKEVKEYLISKYDLGEKTGNKCDPKKVADDMRYAKLQNGDRRFTREEWLGASQIKSFFSRITAARRKQTQQGTQIHVDIDDNDLDEWLEDVEAIEEVNERIATIEDVMSEIAMSHPIAYDSYDLCEMRKNNGLKAFNVKMLKEMCRELEVQLKSRDTKIVIIEKLENELLKCTCCS